MKYPTANFISRKCLATLLFTAMAAISPLSAANLTWDIGPDTDGIQPGNGTWDINTTNNWSNNGTGNTTWTQSNATSALHSAQFAGADAPEGTYTVSLNSSVAIASTNGALRFSNNGTLLTASTGTNPVITTPQITTDINRTAVLSGNLTLAIASGTQQIFGYGTLIARDGVRINPLGNPSFAIGSKFRLQSGAVYTTAGSPLLGGQTSDGSTTEVTVEGGNMNVSGTNINIVLANVGAANQTGLYSNTILTLSSGNITNTSAGGGLRFGNAQGNATFNFNVNGVLNLNGGVLTTARIYEANGVISNQYNSVVNFNGGTLRALPSTTFGSSFLQGLNTANVRAGGAIIDSNGVSITVGQALVAELSGNVSTGGGLTKVGNGTLTLTGNNTYTGNTTVSAGTLAITVPTFAPSPVAVAPSARLQIRSGNTTATLPGLSLPTDSGVNLNLGVYNSGVVSSASVVTFNAAGDYKVDLSGTNIPIGNYTVFTYSSGNKTGVGLPVVGSLPPGVTATVQDTGSAVQLSVLSPQLANYTWAAGNGTWDTTTANWAAPLTTFVDERVATFPNLAGDRTITLGASLSPFSVEFQNDAANTYTLIRNGTGNLGGNGTLIKNGSGILTLSSANSYAGTTSINAGAVLVTVDSALGTAAGATAVSSGAALGLVGGVNYGSAEPVIGSGPGNLAALGTLATVQRGFIQGVSGSSTFAGPVTLGSNTAHRIGSQNGASLTLTGNITLAPGVTGARTGVPGASILFRPGNNPGDFITLSGSGNEWDSDAAIFTGAGGYAGVRLGIDDALPVTTSVASTGGSSGVGNALDLNGFNQTLDGLMESAGDLAITNLKPNTTSTLTLDVAVEDISSVAPVVPLPGASDTNPYTIISDGGFDGGVVALIKKGGFKQTLTGTHTYSGNTRIEAGTLAFSGDTSIGATAVTILAGSTLDVSAVTAPGFALSGGLTGSGNLTATGKTATVSTTFAPGALAVSGNLTLAPGTATTLIASTTPGASSAVTVSDGTLTFGGNLAINPADGFAFATGQSFTFATGTIVAGLNEVSVAGNPLTGASGVWTATFGGLDYTFTEANATLVVSGGIVISPLQAWRNIHFPGAGNDGTGIGANNFDADGDGIANLVEYATNTSPVAANASVVIQGIDAGRLTLTFPRIDDPTLRYTVEARNDLVTGSWGAVVPSLANNPTFGFVGSTPGVTETVSETVIDSTLISASSKRFLRLAIDFVP